MPAKVVDHVHVMAHIIRQELALAINLLIVMEHLLLIWKMMTVMMTPAYYSDNDYDDNEGLIIDDALYGPTAGVVYDNKTYEIPEEAGDNNKYDNKHYESPRGSWQEWTIWKSQTKLATVTNMITNSMKSQRKLVIGGPVHNKVPDKAGNEAEADSGT